MTDLTNLKLLTQELAEEIKGNFHAGPLFGLLSSYFDTIDTNIAMVRSDKVVLFLNKTTRKRLKELNIDPDKFINSPCIPSVNNCGLSSNCPLEECVKKKKVITRIDVTSPCSDKHYTVVCLPLKYNGVSAVIEMWTEVE